MLLRETKHIDHCQHFAGPRVESVLGHFKSVMAHPGYGSYGSDDDLQSLVDNLAELANDLLEPM